MVSIGRLLAVAVGGAALASCQNSARGTPAIPEQPVGNAATEYAWPDECRTLPGYQLFRAQLEKAVAERSGQALRALFHPRGVMRVYSIGGRSSTPDWGFGRPEAKAVWTELEQILPLGCATRSGKLYLPAMAVQQADDMLLVLDPANIQERPDEASLVLRRAGRGDRFVAYIHNQPPGWTQVLINDRVGYVRTDAVRSPSSFRLVLVPFGEGWRITEFSDGA